MKILLLVLMLFVACIVDNSAMAAERMLDLFRQGYQIFYTEPYISFDSCEYDKARKIGPYVFICQSYDYIYHYGKAELMKGGGGVYLCLGEDKCIRGELYRR